MSAVIPLVVLLALGGCQDLGTGPDETPDASSGITSWDGGWKSKSFSLGSDWFSATGSGSGWGSAGSDWHPSGEELVVYRRKITLPSTPGSAQLRITVDNIYIVLINDYPQNAPSNRGFFAADGNWRNTETYDVSSALNSGSNTLAIVAVDGGGPEFMSMTMTVDGSVVATNSDGRWEAIAFDLGDGWFGPNFSGSAPTSPWTNSPGSPVTSSKSMWDSQGGEVAVFVRTFTLDEIPTRADLNVSADNVYAVLMNDYPQHAPSNRGFFAADGNWRNTETYDVRGGLVVGVNTLAIIALDTGGFNGVYFDLAFE